MSVVNEIARAVGMAKRELHMAVALRDTAGGAPLPIPPRFAPWQIEQMLRIEMRHEIRAAICSVHDLGRPWPTTFMGVAVYVCGLEYDLPECGWRVVNPLDKPEARG